jgi:hypothetical protein
MHQVSISSVQTLAQSNHFGLKLGCCLPAITLYPLD